MPQHTAGRLVMAGVALLTALTVTACTGDADHGTMPGMGTGSAPPSGAASGSVAFNDADVTFAQHMIPHHQQAVSMATLAGTKANDPELQQLAAWIKAAQQPEIDKLTGWLTAWGRPTAMAGGHDMGAMPGMMSEPDMAALAAADGAAFDKRFATMMIAHHKGAIEMARTEMSNGLNTEAKVLAAQIVQTQEAEVTTLQTILTRLS